MKFDDIVLEFELDNNALKRLIEKYFSLYNASSLLHKHYDAITNYIIENGWFTSSYKDACASIECSVILIDKIPFSVIESWLKEIGIKISCYKESVDFIDNCLCCFHDDRRSIVCLDKGDDYIVVYDASGEYINREEGVNFE